MRSEARDIRRRMLGEQLLLLPNQEMRCVGGVDDVDVLDAGLEFLADPLEHALGTRALNLERDVRILGAKRLRDSLGDFYVDCGVPNDLAFLRGRGNLCRRCLLTHRVLNDDGYEQRGRQRCNSDKPHNSSCVVFSGFASC